MWMDTVEIRQAVGTPSQSPAMSSLLSGLGGRTVRSNEAGMSNLDRVQDQLRSYWGWNYVFIKRIMNTVGSQKPIISRLEEGPSGPSYQGIRSYAVDDRQRQHLGTHYGMQLQAAMDLRPITKHPAVRLLDRPNDEDTWNEFVSETVLFLKLTGEFYWYVVRSVSGLPIELHVVPNNLIGKGYNAANGAMRQTHWNLQTPNGTERLETSDVIVYREKNPASKTDGFSSSEAGARWLEASRQVETSRFHSFDNGGRPDVVFELDASQWAAAQNGGNAVLDRLEERFGRRWSIKRHGGVGVIPPGVKPHSFQFNPREMDYSGSSAELRDNTGALHGVNKFIGGITSEMNHNQVWAALTQYYEITINPLLSDVAGVIMHKLLPLFDPQVEAKGIIVWFADCKPIDREQELRETELDWRMGAIEPDERRIQRGRQPRGTAAHQTSYLPGGLVPLGDFNSDDNAE